MNEETIISFENQNGFRIAPDSDITTGKVIVNDIEITSVEDWEKVTHLIVELQKENEKLNHYKLLYQKVKERADELEEDMKFVLEQTLGAFTQNWCIDWNFTDIREKYSISDNYKWNKGNNEE